ncbi:MAG: CRISPR-associated protein Csx3 [Campylobacterales bacterium]
MIHFDIEPLNSLSATLISFTIQEGVTNPTEAFSIPLPKVAFDRGVVISGRGPIWLYARLIHHYHPARWIAIHDPRIGYVVVQSHSKERREGEVIIP